MIKKECIVLFVKYPEKNNVKTRLQNNLNTDFILNLYKQFILHIISILKKSGINFIINITPEYSLDNFKKWLGNDYNYMIQHGNTLGERLDNTFKDIFKKNYHRALIIGSDIPDINENILKKSLQILQKQDTVIGPSGDGGYYLIGFNKESYINNIFYGFEWSTDKVLKKSVHILNELKIKFRLIKKLNDIDYLNDLISFYNKYKNKKGSLYDFLRNNEGMFYK